ncbi:hypothetical protein GB937_002961 [Aspergillus fischeri]|nr:hypothetical protein GB937_002961 [Aspergillus fischeri]
MAPLPAAPTRAPRGIGPPNRHRFGGDAPETLAGLGICDIRTGRRLSRQIGRVRAPRQEGFYGAARLLALTDFGPGQNGWIYEALSNFGRGQNGGRYEGSA